MKELFFANYRLVVDDEIAADKIMQYRADFFKPMPYTHTFIMRKGDSSKLGEIRAYAKKCRTAFETEFFTIHDTHDSWTFANTEKDELRFAPGAKNAIQCSRDYGDITVYMTDQYFDLKSEHCTLYHRKPAFPFSSSIRAICEAGMVMRDGLPLHASLVEKDGCGIIF